MAQLDPVVGGGSREGAEIGAALLRHADAADRRVGAVAGGVVGLAEVPVTGALGAASCVADGLVVLARTVNALAAQLARYVTTAQVHDLLPVTVRTMLQQQGWAGSDADAMVTAAPFADRYPDLRRLWRQGRISTAAVATLARGLRPLPAAQVHAVVASALPHLTGMSIAELRGYAARAVELLRPQDADERERYDFDRRFVVAATANGVTHLEGLLPALEGEAVVAALTALGESLRVEGDGLSPGQRRADALITLVNQAATHGDIPATSGGLPVAASVTLGLAEAERLAAGQPRTRPDTLADAVLSCGRPSRVGSLGYPAATLGDAAGRFVMCCGLLTGMLVSGPHHPAGHDHARQTGGTADTGGDGSSLDGRAGGFREGSSRPGAGHLDPTRPGPHDGEEALAGIVAQALANTRLEPLAMGRATRLATPAQRKALLLRDGGCVVAGCTRPAAECQAHHVRAWADGGGTDLANLALACWAHHRLIEFGRIQLTPNNKPDGPYWTSTATPRHTWQRRAA